MGYHCLAMQKLKFKANTKMLNFSLHTLHPLSNFQNRTAHIIAKLRGSTGQIALLLPSQFCSKM